jgi:hypothetical protein
VSRRSKGRRRRLLVFVKLEAAFDRRRRSIWRAWRRSTLDQIFSGTMPCKLIVIVCMVLLYLWPGLTLSLPNFLDRVEAQGRRQNSASSMKIRS